MTEFFNTFQTLPVTEKIYWFVAIPATVLLLIQLIITLLAGDLHGDTDIHGDSADFSDDGLHIFTYKNILGFFTIFSWTGLGFLKLGFGLFLTLLFSMIAGIIMMVLMAWIFYKISQLNESGTMDINNAIDKRCEVYLTIPPAQRGRGKVLIVIQGSTHELDAVTDDAEPIPTGSIALVIEVAGDETLLVTKINY
jgi:hypothetical protein